MVLPDPSVPSEISLFETVLIPELILNPYKDAVIVLDATPIPYTLFLETTLVPVVGPL